MKVPRMDIQEVSVVPLPANEHASIDAWRDRPWWKRWWSRLKTRVIYLWHRQPFGRRRREERMRRLLKDLMESLEKLK